LPEQFIVLKHNLFDFWKTFRRSPMGMIGAFLVTTTFLAAVFAPWLASTDINSTVRDANGHAMTFAPPSAHGPLGTDDAGRDVWSQLVFGARISLMIGFLAGFISASVGSFLGILAGYFGGKTDILLMRITDILLVIPDLPLMLILVATVRQLNLKIAPQMILILVISLLYWTHTARLIRSQVLTIKERQFVSRSRAIGAGNMHIIIKHILPQIMPLIVANSVLLLSTAILVESGLAFLGLGDPTRPSWGTMLNFAFDRNAVTNGAWWFFLPPGFAIVWVSLGCVLLGNVLEEMLNPRLSGHHLEGEQKVLTKSTAQGRIGDQPLLSVRHLSADYVSIDGSVSHALEDVSFDVTPGQTIGLVGESGCGKTTTLLSVMRLLPASARITSGQVWFRDVDLLTLSEREMRDHRWKDIAIIFQGAMNALNPVVTVGEQIREAILQHGFMDLRAADQKVDALLDLVGIAKSRKSQYPHQYSGGMRQRAMIAMALACAPPLLFADEPTTALDVMIQAQVLELLKRIQYDLGLAIVLVTHDLGVVAEMCDAVVVMYGGKVAEYGPAELVYNQPQHPYTQRLLEAFPDLNRPTDPSTGSAQDLSTIPGTPPRLNALPPGCRFSPRCRKSIEICTQIAPNLMDMAAPGSGVRHLAACHLLNGEEIEDL
jgi:peptide/nickel transport system permease protein